VAGDPYDISVGGTDVRRITGHMAATQPSWVGGRPTNRAETASSMELNEQWYQPAELAPTGSSDAGCRPESTASDIPFSAAVFSAAMRCSWAACQTLHNAARGRHRLEHSGQRPRGSGA
jgi:hypothetical protein